MLKYKIKMRVLLDINDNKAEYLLEILKNLPFVKTKQLTDTNAEILENLKEAVDEMKLIKSEKKQGISARQMLYEL